MSLEPVKRQSNKKYVRKLSPAQIEYLRQFLPSTRIYVYEIDGCFGGLARSFDCEYCLVSTKCNKLKKAHLDTDKLLIGRELGWVEAGSE